MKKLVFAILFIVVVALTANSQSLKPIIKDKNLVVNDSSKLNAVGANLMKNEIKTLKEKKGDFLAITVGFMNSENEKPVYGSFDMNINLGFISDIFYLNMAVYGINTKQNYFGAEITPGIGLDFFRKRIFAFAGAGYFVILPYSGYDFALRVNYNITKQFSFGLDNKIILFGSSSNFKTHIYSIGVNTSYRYNF